MGRHALRGAVTAWMALIVLRTVGTSGGSGKLAGLFTDANKVVQRVLSPEVAAIPDRRNGLSTASQMGYITPAQSAAAAKAAANLPGIAAVTSPTGALSGAASLQQYSTGGGLSAAIASNPSLR